MVSDRRILILFEATSYDMLLSSLWFPAGADSGETAARVTELGLWWKAASLNPWVGWAVQLVLICLYVLVLSPVDIKGNS